MEHLDHRNAGGLRAIDEMLHPLDEGRHLLIPVVGAMAKRFLGIDDDEGGVGHFRSPCDRLMARAYPRRCAAKGRFRTEIGQIAPFDVKPAPLSSRSWPLDFDRPCVIFPRTRVAQRPLATSRPPAGRLRTP